MKRFVFFLLLLSWGTVIHAQADRWQQHIKYVMDINLDVNKNIMKGKQTITYTNNSPDTLKRVFLHLFWNAFQPGSMMDISSRNSENIQIGNKTDFDPRFRRKINELTPEEQGYCNVVSFLYNGKPQTMKVHETILEVILDKPILPKSTATFISQFESQVPKLSRRSGRDNLEGVRFSMGQWYPKVSEYDDAGWHPDDYIRGEFYGVWGDYDVTLTLDKNYKVGATGILQNAAAIGWGYDKEGTPLKPVNGNTRTWIFSGKNIHDFAWTADPTYKHITRQVENGPLLHFIYLENPASEAGWQTTADNCAAVYPFMSKTFGAYPYPVYSFLQGSGGGTEYPMATMIHNSSFETALHEWCHSWYQMMLGTNESLYAWMDEGFTDYAEARVLAWFNKKDFFADAPEYDEYFYLAKSPFDEPMSTHANQYTTNLAYNINAYYKGAVFLRQLGYIVGESNIDKILLAYYNEWRFKHPTPNDFIRVAEKVSNMQLQWYKEFMVNTTKTIDYAFDSLWEAGGKTKIRIKRIGEMPMPIDLKLTFRDSTAEMHYVPLSLMYGEKPAEDSISRKIYPAWKWMDNRYTIETDRKIADILTAEIDPTNRLADIRRQNNKIRLR